MAITLAKYFQLKKAVFTFTRRSVHEYKGYELTTRKVATFHSFYLRLQEVCFKVYLITFVVGSDVRSKTEDYLK